MASGRGLTAYSLTITAGLITVELTAFSLTIRDHRRITRGSIRAYRILLPLETTASVQQVQLELAAYSYY